MNNSKERRRVIYLEVLHVSCKDEFESFSKGNSPRVIPLSKKEKEEEEEKREEGDFDGGYNEPFISTLVLGRQTCAFKDGRQF